MAAGEEDVEVLIERWRKTNRYSPMLTHPRPLNGPSVKYNNSISEACTVIEINAGDRTGLLHDEASVLSQLGLDVRAAKISTIASRARGVFYVLDSDGKKIESRERMARIERVDRKGQDAPSRRGLMTCPLRASGLCWGWFVWRVVVASSSCKRA